MSATLIEMLIVEATRDGVLSQEEIQSIHEQAQALDVSKGLVDSLINNHLAKLQAEANLSAEKERLQIEREKARKYELFEMTFEKLARKWICKSATRVLDRKDYMPDLIREAQQMKIEITWLENWITKLEKSEQEIAGIKPSLFVKIKGLFGK